MKILMASHYFSSHTGGVEVVAEHLFSGLTARDQEVVWLAGDATPPPPPIRKSRAVPLHIFNFVEERIGLPFPIPTPGALGKINREVRGADVAILHDCLYLSNIFAFLSAQFHRLPVIIVQHTRFTPYHSSLLNAVMRFSNAVVTRPMLSRTAQVIFISETTNGFFNKLHFKSPPEVVFNGVDTDLYRALNPPETKIGLRRDCSLPESGPVILFVGRFVEKKGIHAMKHMVSLRPDWTWVFAGWGPLDPGSWNAQNVRVFSNLRGPSMAALYRACDLLVLPSTGEGFPLVVQEALASGLSVVCGADTLEADPAIQPFVKGSHVYTEDDERTAKEFVLKIEAQLALEKRMEHVGGAGMSVAAGVSPAQAEQSSAPTPEARSNFAISRYSWHSAIERYLEIASRLVTSKPNHAPTSEKVAE